MARYWVAFRIEDDPDYSARHQALHDTMDRLGTGFWNDGTALIAIESEERIDAMGQALKGVLGAQDFLVIREIGQVNTRYAGEPSEGFRYFFPDAKKL